MPGSQWRGYRADAALGSWIFEVKRNLKRLKAQAREFLNHLAPASP
jgi:hypothetical protein